MFKAKGWSFTFPISSKLSENVKFLGCELASLSLFVVDALFGYAMDHRPLKTRINL